MVWIHDIYLLLMPMYYASMLALLPAPRIGWSQAGRQEAAYSQCWLVPSYAVPELGPV